MYFELYNYAPNDFHFTITLKDNDSILCRSKSFTSRDAAMKAILELKRKASSATIKEPSYLN